MVVENDAEVASGGYRFNLVAIAEKKGEIRLG
jgi:hypothetical protein